MGVEIERKFLVDHEKWRQVIKPAGTHYRQGYLLNDQNQIIDSLFIPGQNIIESGITDVNNNVLSYVDSKLVAVFDKNKIQNLAQCKQIKFVSYLYLPNQPIPIKINEDSYLDLVLSAYLNYKAKSK